MRQEPLYAPGERDINMVGHRARALPSNPMQDDLRALDAQRDFIQLQLDHGHMDYATTSSTWRCGGFDAC